jgi:(2Fe-2S) ferredoxin
MNTSNNKNHPPDAIVVLGRGGYGDGPTRELLKAADAVRATGRYSHVTSAFIDHGAPSLPQALAEVVACGARSVIVVPAFVPVDRTLRTWLPKAIRRWTKKVRLQDVRITLADPPGLGPGFGDLIAAHAEAAEAMPDVREGSPARDVADQWLGVPAHRHHVLQCTGPRCTTLGSMESWEHLRNRLDAASLREREDGVLTVRTGCLYPCNWGPMMVVHPGGYWYGAVTSEVVDEIVESHFIKGTPVQRHLRPRPLPPSPG